MQSKYLHSNLIKCMNKFLRFSISCRKRLLKNKKSSTCQFISEYRLVGEPKSRILQNDKKFAPDFDMAEFLYIGRLNSA